MKTNTNRKSLFSISLLTAITNYITRLTLKSVFDLVQQDKRKKKRRQKNEANIESPCVISRIDKSEVNALPPILGRR